MFEDESSAVFKFGETLVNLLDASAAPELIQPAYVSGLDRQRLGFTPEFDAKCRELAARGVQMLNGPMDQAKEP